MSTKANDPTAKAAGGHFKPRVQLTGQDGNVFAIIGRVSGALKQAGQAERAAEFREKAIASGSYGDVLNLCAEYVRVA